MKLQEKLRSVGVECELVYLGALAVKHSVQINHATRSNRPEQDRTLYTAFRILGMWAAMIPQTRPLWPSARQALVIQFVASVWCSAYLDGGRRFNGCLLASLLFWACSGLLLLWQRSRLSWLDVIFLRWGLVVFVVFGTPLLMPVADLLATTHLMPLAIRVVLVAGGLLLLIMGFLIRRGKTQLIPGYDSSLVRDEKGLANWVGWCLMVVGAISVLAGGLISVLPPEDTFIPAILFFVFIPVAAITFLLGMLRFLKEPVEPGS